MAIGSRYYSPFQQQVSAAGVPYIGGLLYFYLTETSTPLDTYSDVDLQTANANPVEALDDGSWGPIWLSQSQAYKVVLKDADGVQIWSADPVGPASGGAVQTVTGIIGEVRDFAGPAASIPAQWYLCYGQAVSRTDFSAAYAVLGTTWGAGDGSTTFNLPDLRGRVTVGKDDMGGVAVNRITAGVSGVPGTTLGGVGGSQLAQTDTLTAVSTVTDAGHTHVTNAVQGPTPTPGLNVGAGVGYLWAAASNTSAVTGVTVATTVTSGLTGTSQNVQPVAVVNKIIFLGA